MAMAATPPPLTLLDALLVGDVPLAQRSLILLEQSIRERAAILSSSVSSSKKKLVKAPSGVSARKRGSGSSPAPVITEVVSTASVDYDPRADFEILGLLAVAVRAGATAAVVTAPTGGQQQQLETSAVESDASIESLRVSCGTFLLAQMRTFTASQIREVVGSAKEPL